MNKRETKFRVHKVASLINIALVEVLRRGKQLNQRLLNCPLTITKLEVSRDLKIADCYFVPFNTTLTIHEIQEALDNSKFAIRELVTRKINLKYSPAIRFYYDRGFDNANKVEQLLKDMTWVSGC